MKHLKINCLVILLFLSHCSFGQSYPAVNCSLTTPYTTCLNQSVSATVMAYAGNFTTNFVWTISPGAGTVVLSPQQINQVNGHVGITYTSCGLHTISVMGYSGSAVTCTSNLVVNVLCNSSPGPIVVSPTNALVCPGFSAALSASGAISYTWYPGVINQPTISAAPGIYTVVGTNSIGCTNQQTVEVVLGPPLELTLTQSSFTTCMTSNSPQLAKSVTLTATGAASYTWSPNNPNPPGPVNIVQPATNSCYTVNGSNSTCSGSAATCVTVLPQYSIGISTISLLMCKGESRTLGVTYVGSTATGPPSAFTYTWTEAQNAPPVSISSYSTPTVAVFPKNSTTYTIEMRDAANCISQPKYISVAVKPCTDLGQELKESDQYIVFPNAAHDRFYISSKHRGLIDLELVDMYGHVYLKRQRFFEANKKEEFKVEDLPRGLYLLKLAASNENLSVIRLLLE